MNDRNTGHGSFAAPGLSKNFDEIPFLLHAITFVDWTRLIVQSFVSERRHSVSPIVGQGGVNPRGQGIALVVPALPTPRICSNPELCQV